MKKTWHYFGQGFFYFLFIAFIGYFSSMPTFENMPPDKALVKFTFMHASKRVKPFKDTRTAQDLAKLSPQLRYRKHSRERSPMHIEFDIDGRIVYKATIKPRGLSRDLPAPVYQRFIIPAGKHFFRVRMGDDVNNKGFIYTNEKTMVLAPLQVLVIDFDNIRKQFVFE